MSAIVKGIGDALFGILWTFLSPLVQEMNSVYGTSRKKVLVVIKGLKNLFQKPESISHVSSHLLSVCILALIQQLYNHTGVMLHAK